MKYRTYILRSSGLNVLFCMIMMMTLSGCEVIAAGLALAIGWAVTPLIFGAVATIGVALYLGFKELMAGSGSHRAVRERGWSDESDGVRGSESIGSSASREGVVSNNPVQENPVNKKPSWEDKPHPIEARKRFAATIKKAKGLDLETSDQIASVRKAIENQKKAKSSTGPATIAQSGLPDKPHISPAPVSAPEPAARSIPAEAPEPAARPVPPDTPDPMASGKRTREILQQAGFLPEEDEANGPRPETLHGFTKFLLQDRLPIDVNKSS